MNQKQVINTSEAPSAIGPYSQAIKIGNFIFTSGQLPIDPKTGEFAPGDIKNQAEQAIKNLKAVLEEGGSSLENVVKTTVFLKDIADFAAVNEVYAQFFTGKFPARSCIQVAKIPKDAGVEIEAVAIING